MHKLLATAAATAALSIAVPALAQDQYQQRSDAEFAELVEGYEAGEATQCINVFNGNRVRVVENVGIVYERGDTMWVARVRNPRSLGPWDVPIFERYGSQLCTHDIRRTVDRSTGMISGIPFFDDFVAYREVDDA